MKVEYPMKHHFITLASALALTVGTGSLAFTQSTTLDIGDGVTLTINNHTNITKPSEPAARYVTLHNMHEGDNACLKAPMTRSEGVSMKACDAVGYGVWSVKSTGDDAGSVRIRMATRSEDGMPCLDGNTNLDATPAKAVACTKSGSDYSDTQSWIMNDEGNGWYSLRTLIDSETKCLEANAETSPFMEGKSFMNSCQNVSGQRWKLTDDNTF